MNGNKLGKKLREVAIKGIGKATIKTSEQAVGRCRLFYFYEPKIPIKILKETSYK